MQNNLTYLSNRLVTGKWLLAPSDYECLAKQVDKALTSDARFFNRMASALVEAFSKKVANEMEVDVPEASVEGMQYAAVIPVCGVLMKGVSEEMEAEYGLCNVDRIGLAIDDAIKDPSVSEIVLDFNSPGGEVTGIDILARKISTSPKPIHGWTSTRAASGAMWLISQCSTIGITPDASLGSVGVYSMFEDYSKALEEAGVSVTAIHAGKYKMLGHSYKPMTEEEKALVQADVDNTYIKFKSAILSKRNIKDEDMQGLMYEGQVAVDKGYADFISDSLEGYLTTKETDSMKSFTKVELGASPKVATIAQEAMAPKAEVKAGAEEPKKEEPKAEEPKHEEPKAEEPKKEEPAKEEAKRAKMDDEHNVTCPHCAKAFAIDYDGDKAEAEEPVKEEPKAEAEEPKEEPKHEEEKSASAPITMGAIFGLNPIQKKNLLQSACDEAVKSVLGL